MDKYFIKKYKIVYIFYIYFYVYNDMIIMNDHKMQSNYVIRTFGL